MTEGDGRKKDRELYRQEIKRETRRYLGYGKSETDAATEEMIGSCIDEIFQTCTPRFLEKESGLTLPEGKAEIITDAFQTESRNLRKNLEGCERILFFAATLGAGADLLIQKYERIRMSRAVVLQAAAAACIEACCDRENARLKLEYEKKGWFMRPRFSPGYGDFSLECQKGILGALEAGKRIGLTLTDSLLMAPSKSVTAVIGLSRIPGGCTVKGCEACGKSDCAYRR